MNLLEGVWSTKHTRSCKRGRNGELIKEAPPQLAVWNRFDMDTSRAKSITAGIIPGEFELMIYDMIVMTSDGVHDNVDEATTLQILQKHYFRKRWSPPKAVAQALVDAALINPRRQDDISCVVAYVCWAK